MPKPESKKRSRAYTTWVTGETGERIERAAEQLGWTPCQLIRNAVETRMPELERMVNLLESSQGKPRR